jgi:hypothetical protein
MEHNKINKPAPERPPVPVVLFVLSLLALLPVVAAGYLASYETLVQLAIRLGWEHPATLPIVTDAMIPAFLLLDFAYTIGGRGMPLLRWGAWAGTAFTIYANYSVDDSVLRTIPPLIPVMAAETFRIYCLYRKGLDDDTMMDRVRFMRWVVSPIRTTILRVRMHRSELTSYRSAIALEDAVRYARSVARAELERIGRKPRLLVLRRRLPEDVFHRLKDWRLPARARVLVDRSVTDPAVDWESAVAGWIRTSVQTAHPDCYSDPKPEKRRTTDRTETGGTPDPKPDRTSDPKPDPKPDRTSDPSRTETRFDVGPFPDRDPEESLLGWAQRVNDKHVELHNRPISAENLRTVLRCSKPTANALTHQVRGDGESPLRAVSE